MGESFPGEFKETLEGITGADDLILPEHPIMGDLRHIRNDLVHHRSVATTSNTGRCALLRWFAPESPMTFNIAHVLTVLHELNILTRGVVGRQDYEGRLGKLAMWASFSVDHLRARQPTPEAISVRTELWTHPTTNEIHLRMSLVYDNGFFFEHTDPCGAPDTEENRIRLNGLSKETAINPRGDIDIPALGVSIPSQAAYARSVDGYEQLLQRTDTDGPSPPGFPGPFIRIRR